LIRGKAYGMGRLGASGKSFARQAEIFFGGFLRRWREKDALKPDAIAITKPDIADAFDEIIGLEIGKRRTNTN
jgi:hypothetical protein